MDRSRLLVIVTALLLPFVFGFAGCGAAGTEVASAPKVAAPDSDQPKIDEPAVDEPVVDEPQVDQPAADPDEKPYNPNRLFQLANLERIEVKIEGDPYKVWVMDTMPKMQEGMMFLTEQEVQPDEGMLFVYWEERPLSFWMRNTLLPLDIAYIRADGTVVNVGQGKPLDESSVPSKGNAKYVLEFRQGFFKRHGYGAGSKVTIPATVRFKDN